MTMLTRRAFLGWLSALPLLVRWHWLAAPMLTTVPVKGGAGTGTGAGAGAAFPFAFPMTF